jgi:hypothetical protein
MNEVLSNEERGRSGSPLLAVLAFLSTLLLITGLISGEAPAREGPAASVAAPAATVSGPAEGASNEMLGCGEAESCYASN